MAGAATITTKTTTRKQLALIMGVANQRSIAWSCVESFLTKNYDCIITYRPDNNNNNDPTTKQQSGAGGTNNLKIQKMIHQLHTNLDKQNNNNNNNNNNTTIMTNNNYTTGRVIGYIPCNVLHDIPLLFQERIPEILYHQQQEESIGEKNSTEIPTNRTIDSIVHCLAYMNTKDGSNSNNNNNNNNNDDENDGAEGSTTTTTTKSSSSSLLLTNASWETYNEAQYISAYSLIETARYAVLLNPIVSDNASITALSYIGAVRSVPNLLCNGTSKSGIGINYSWFST